MRLGDVAGVKLVAHVLDTHVPQQQTYAYKYDVKERARVTEKAWRYLLGQGGMTHLRMSAKVLSILTLFDFVSLKNEIDIRKLFNNFCDTPVKVEKNVHILEKRLSLRQSR